MAEPSMKKRKTRDNHSHTNEHPVVTDVRFANIQSDPRFRLPSKGRGNVKVDKRFSHMLRDDDFTRKAKVDRYGRRLEDDAERRRLKRRYEFEDGVDDDIEVEKELKRVEGAIDPIRDGGFSQDSSSEESSSNDDESNDDSEVQAHMLGNQQDLEVPVGSVSSRIAVVNLDWDNIRAADLMAVFSSFLPSAGHLLKVTIYPSNFGRTCMEREEMEGPPSEIFTSVKPEAAQGDVGREPDDLEHIKESLVQPDTGEDFDPAALRRYQLQRLQYFYAVLVFSSAEIARSVYDTIDGTEYLTSANFFDLRFIPDDTEFLDDNAKDECETIPAGYKPNAFVTDALQHSNVKLTWDADDASRKTAQAKAFRGSRKDIDENDLKAYLGSDSSSDEGPQPGGEMAIDRRLPKKEQERQKMRALLGLGAEPKPRNRADDAPVGDLKITFSSGLLGEHGSKRSVFKDGAEAEETTVEKYVRKEQERKQTRKERTKSAREGRKMTGEQALGHENSGETKEDLGFDDPFFAAPEHDKAPAAKMRKEERVKKRAEREAEEAAAATEKAELELLMIDDKDEGREMRHFDMKEIEKNEKRSKNRRKLNKKQRADESGREPQGDIFKIDTQDPRFSRLYENHEFAIDPTNPRYKGTEGMRALLEEGRKHKKKKNPQQQESKQDVHNSGRASRQNVEGVHKLVDKLKERQSVY